MRGFLWRARDNHKVGSGAAVQKNLVAFLMDTNCSNLIRNRNKSGAKYFDRSADCRSTWTQTRPLAMGPRQAGRQAGNDFDYISQNMSNLSVF